VANDLKKRRKKINKHKHRKFLKRDRHKKNNIMIIFANDTTAV